MSGRFSAWWRLRSSREQRLLLVMFALMGVTAAWLLVIRPLGDLLADARADAARATIATSATEARADAIRVLERSRPPTLRAPVANVLAEAAAEAGFAGARIAPGPDGVTVTIESARPPAFFGWVEGIEARRGLVVDRLGTQPTGNGTISATVTFRERGA